MIPQNEDQFLQSYFPLVRATWSLLRESLGNADLPLKGFWNKILILVAAEPRRVASKYESIKELRRVK